MGRKFKRPRNDQELVEKEAIGFWQAQALAKDIAESSDKITLDTIRRIHQEFFKNAIPEIAGRFRELGADVMDLQCVVPPPGGPAVEQQMYAFWRELDTRVATISRKPKGTSLDSRRKWTKKVIALAAWTHHRITAVHPFHNGNGRMARIMNNVVLRRFALQPSDIQHLGDNKAKYLDALCQIDKAGDYGPLEKMVAEGMQATYEKVYAIAKKNAAKKSKKPRH